VTKKINVLVVDAAVVTRQILFKTLSKDKNINVIDSAINGRLALSKNERLKPDVVVMDIDMPEMDGVQVLNEIRKKDKDLPIIMFSSTLIQESDFVKDCFRIGASGCLWKPQDKAELLACIDEELKPLIKELHYKKHTKTLSSTESERKRQKNRIDVVALGISTGGPEALSWVLSQLPVDFPVPVVVVQHMKKEFIPVLVERLNRTTPLKVLEASDSLLIEKGHIYFAPGERHLVVSCKGWKVLFKTNEDAPQNSCRPSVDVLFKSMAEVYGPHVLAVVLTGIGKDGTEGSRHVLEAKGQVIIQDERSSTVWGMPRAVFEKGYYDEISSLETMAESILDLVKEFRS